VGQQCISQAEALAQQLQDFTSDAATSATSATSAALALGPGWGNSEPPGSTDPLETGWWFHTFFIFHFIYGIINPSHSRTHIFQDG